MQCVSSAVLYFCLTSETQAYKKHKTNLKWDIKQRQFGSSAFLVFDFFGIFFFKLFLEKYENKG